jgi:HEAT repeat protein
VESAEVVTSLLTALCDEVRRVKYQAARSLSQLAQKVPEIVVQLEKALDSGDRQVRFLVAQSLHQIQRGIPKVAMTFADLLREEDSWSVRTESARFLGQIAICDEDIISVLYKGLLDVDHDVRTACARSLAFLGQRFPEFTEGIIKRLIHAIEDPAFYKTDNVGRTSHDYAFEGLWVLLNKGAL